jgi:hypothetical protein
MNKMIQHRFANANERAMIMCIQRDEHGVSIRQVPTRYGAFALPSAGANRSYNYTSR